MDRPHAALAPPLGLALALVAGCGGAFGTVIAASGGSTGEALTTAADPTTTTAADTTTGEAPPEGALVTHTFGVRALAPHEESFPCIQWTVDNDQALYVNDVILSNDGGFHHSNWFVLTEDLYPGDDGYFNCSDRGFDEYVAAIQGAVLFAQSTQSRVEHQALPAGVVVKIPPRAKIMTVAHLLNASTAPLESELRMGLQLIHPRDVDVVAAPFRLSFEDLQIPPKAHSRQSAACRFDAAYEKLTGKPFDLRLYHVLPHYHYLGERFTLDIVGGPRDGERIFELDGFNGAANGKSFDPPIDLSGAEGLRFACDFYNWTDAQVGYGVGDQEMCMMLGLADARGMMNGVVLSGAKAVGQDQDGTILYEGPCDALVVPKTPAHTMPTAEEIGAPLYVPPGGGGELPPVKPCVDADPAAMPSVPPTLAALRGALFEPTCAYSSCHGDHPSGSAAGLSFLAPDLHAELLGHQVVADTDLPLITPGDPEASWLYRRVARCETQDAGGALLGPMPLGAPTLVDAGLVAALREWIAAGAPAE